MGVPVRVFFSNFGNYEPSVIVGQVRRLCDEQGRPGIMAKAGEVNEQVLAKGYLRTVWPKRSQAVTFKGRCEQVWGDRVTVKIYKAET